MMADINDRLDALEITVSHQEEQLNDLSEMVSSQWKLIERLGGLLTKADARIESLENNNQVDDPSPIDEIPPHY